MPLAQINRPGENNNLQFSHDQVRGVVIKYSETINENQ